MVASWSHSTITVKKNEGFKYEEPSIYYPVFKKYAGQICETTFDKGMVQFLKNWNIQAKHHVQNVWRYQINLLHGIACEILGKDPTTYTSHTWHQSAATNLADTSVSFINLKRHGQWISDFVVEGYIVNAEVLRDKMTGSTTGGEGSSHGRKKAKSLNLQLLAKLLKLMRPWTLLKPHLIMSLNLT